MIKKYRKKPVVVEVMALGRDNFSEVAKWCGGEIYTVKNENNPWKKRGMIGITIKTLEGNMLAEVGDLIIKGVKGEFYPCKPDIFVATYEPV